MLIYIYYNKYLFIPDEKLGTRGLYVGWVAKLYWFLLVKLIYWTLVICFNFEICYKHSFVTGFSN